jgi:two-component system NtrC family sensor kinase
VVKAYVSPQASRRAGVEAGAAAGERPAVLVVDDVAANLIALESLLEGMKCDVVLARSGNEALRLLLKRAFAVMLLDVQMPDMDGYETALHARRNPATRDVPIIFVTATHETEDNALRGYGSGAVDFLFKPVNPTVIRSKVRVFLDLYAGRREIVGVNATLARTNAELQDAYRELQETQAHLVQSAKMASLGQLVAGIAHEVNNPLAFVVSHLDTARRCLDHIEADVDVTLSDEGGRHWERARSRLNEMALGLGRIQELVVKLRTFSRLDEGERKSVSMRDCVDAVLTILGHRLKEIEVETHCGEPDVIDCFPGLLNQALMNLVSNAIDAMDGGKLVITTGTDGADYRITVSDSGGGIPAAVRERVFEPFFTTKPIGQGTGLGLSITYSIVQRHGGTLELRDASCGGTDAIIRLPMTPAERR